ncbi:MAG: aminoglycoside phosphotransferase [Alphaproteobacteria bacterium]|nr:aminoglycoside phosphotransferase [Alphaproteobacteria bacterium]
MRALALGTWHLALNMISINEQQARDFLASYGIKHCEIKKIAGDASFRSYYRIFFGNKTNILMFAPPTHEDIKPFMQVDEFLVSNHFFAPKIFASDEQNGFLLLEDMGDDTYSRILAKDSSREPHLYQKACDVLLDLHHLRAPKTLPSYNHALLFREVMLFVDWYAKPMSLAQKADFKFLWFQIFDLLSKENQVLVLRDFHADNLMVLSDYTQPDSSSRTSAQKILSENEDGECRMYKDIQPSPPSHLRQNFAGRSRELESGWVYNVGLLDFQDAVIGSRVYDLVSLLEDARRDVSEKTRQKILEYYLQKSPCDPEVFLRDYEILSLQRNIKILGIFSRLSKRDGKHQYLSLIPRVARFVEQRINTKNQIFSELKKLIKL